MLDSPEQLLHQVVIRNFRYQPNIILRLNQMDKAIKDADSALKIDPQCTRALSTKAEALYCQGSFERAMVLFTRCSAQSRTDDIVRGINKSRAAITCTLSKVDFPADREIDFPALPPALPASFDEEVEVAFFRKLEDIFWSFSALQLT